MIGEKKLTEIPKFFPNGRLERGSIVNNQLASYDVAVFINEIELNAHLYFEQNEGFIDGLSNDNFSLRSLTITNLTQQKKEKSLNKIKKFIQSTYGDVHILVGIEKSSISYIIENKISIDLKDNEDSIEIEISQFIDLDTRKK